MAVYVTRYCPSCNYKLENLTRDYRAIGKAYVICPNCSQIVKYDHITEWNTKSLFGKLCYIGIMLYTNLLYGLLIPMLYFGLCKLLDISTNEETFVALYIIGFILIGIWSTYQTIQDIKESKQRMKDPKYRKLLKSLGFNI